ncbi:peptidase S8/S53 domain-containing protein [Xylaria flabelliformis]|nr:peptidase S8/S53 domain-containing protein [Xylaria flabelliformis]
MAIGNSSSLETLYRYSSISSHVILSDLCGSIRQSKSQPFNLFFDEDDLWHNKCHPHSSPHPNDSRMLTLGYLLENGFFGKNRDGDIFSLNDKAVLALSLARSLVHLWHGLWTRGPWTADTIRFLQVTNEILDRHNPYVTCALMKSIGYEIQPFKPTLDDLQLSVLGFAQLLVEIETGERLQLDVASVPLEDFRDGIETVMEPRKNEFGRGYYNTAIQRCLQFLALLRRELKNGEEDLLSLARNILYNNIIEPLEKNFSQIPDPATARISHPLKIHGHTTTPVPISSISQAMNASTSIATIKQRDAPRRGDPAIPFNYRDIQMPVKGDSGVMFFDDVATVRKEHIARAEAFFDAFEKFRKRHIVPKIRDGRNGRRRIRVAVLDTGVDQENEDFRGLVDEINDDRKRQRCSRANRNPIKGIKSFIGDDGIDEFGHGTHVAGLVLQTAPDVDLYIAKVSCGKMFKDTEAIVQAIDWAIENEVDIISMSFGSEVDRINVADALDRASNGKRKIILLAAASNSGPNSERTFPARHEGVIAIHSLDGKGNDNGGMNPSRQGYYDNFGTLGLGIETSWGQSLHGPGSLPGSTATTILYKSGSSYATPIAAGIVANCIEWIDYMRTRGHLDEHNYDSLRRLKGIRLMLKKQSALTGDIRSVAPWILWKEKYYWDRVVDGELPREVDEKTDRHVLGLLLEELHLVKPE